MLNSSLLRTKTSTRYLPRYGISRFCPPARLQRGKQQAGKIAELYYNLMTKGIDYVEHGIEIYQQRLCQRHHFVKRTTTQTLIQTGKTAWSPAYSLTC